MDKYDYDEVRIGMLGNVDAGKSTIIGVLTNGILDDGRGSARKNIMRYPHEIECGQTSSVVQHHIRCSDKLVTLTDMAGHEKYFRTTVNGIKRCFVEFAGLVIGANKGIGLDKTETSNVKGNRIYANMTKEHISLINALNLPSFIVMTKIDMVDKVLLKNAIESVKIHYRKFKQQRKVIVIRTKEDLDIIKIYYDAGNWHMPVPLFLVSSVRGDNIDILNLYINEFIKPINSYVNKRNDPVKFVIDAKYRVEGVGRVVSGIITSGTIQATVGNKSQDLYIGPVKGKFYPVKVGTIHNNYRELVPVLKAGQTGCLQLKSRNKDIKLIDNNIIKKGCIITESPNLVSNFKAEVKIFISHHTTIALNTQTVINCDGISQSAKIKSITDINTSIKTMNSTIDENVLRGGDKANVEFEFIHHPEPLENGSMFIFREGRTRGIGKVIEVQ